MSIDVLQNKIRKLKNPAALWLCPVPELVPSKWKEAGSHAAACGGYCRELLEALKEIIPAARVSFDAFALLGPEGLTELQKVLDQAAKLGYFVILDWMHIEDPVLAEYAASAVMGMPCDAVAVSSWAGSDAVKPYVAAAGKKAVFVSLKTGTKSGSELQDLQTGGRQVYTAAGDLVSRWGEGLMERCGYSRVGAVAGAVNAGSLKNLRQKYPKLFLLVEGLETPGANARNCSSAFDKLGHGAVVCGGSTILGAWKEWGDDDYLAAAKDAAEKMKRNLTRYVTIL